MTVLIFPSQLEGEPLESHETFTAQTVEDWLTTSVQKFERRESPPITVTINGVTVAPDDWALTTFRPEDTVRIYPQAKGLETVFFAVQAVAALKFVTGLFMPKIPTMSNKGAQSGERLSESAVKGNSAKLNSPVREVSGQYPVYPDYLMPTHRFFAGPREQVIEMILCVGVGQFDIPLSGVLIGDTPVISLGEEAEFTIFQPGADVSVNSASHWWHSSKEVGATSNGTAGMTLVTTTAVDPVAAASAYEFLAFVVTIPSGAGEFPAGWASGMIAEIDVRYPYTVTDGGAGLRDIIAGNMDQLGFAPGDLIQIAGPNAGFYVVDAITPGVSGTMTLNYEGGAPATALALGTLNMCIGWRGLRYRITAASSSTISLERLDDTGATDSAWIGFAALTSSAVSIVLDESSTEGEWLGPFVACPAGEVTNKIEADLMFPNGLVRVYVDNGKLADWTVTAEIQYRDYAAAGAWSSVIKTYTQKTLDQIGFTETIDLASYYQPEVRVRRIGEKSTKTNVQDLSLIHI